MTMRTTDELQTNLGYWLAGLNEADGLDLERCRGIVSATRYALRHVEVEVQTALEGQKLYRSHGDDSLDAYNDGYVTGLEWSLCLWDWIDETGDAI